jgi:DNA-binding MarR family transcriptional regulator
MPVPLRFLSPLHKATRQVSVWFEQQMKDTGLAPQEGHLLSYLRSYAPCPVGEIVTVFDLRGSTTTSVLDRLEWRSLVVRRVNPEDRRSFLVELTAEGKRLAERVQVFVDQFEAAVARRVSAEEEKGFRAVMAAVGDITNVKLTPRG